MKFSLSSGNPIFLADPLGKLSLVKICMENKAHKAPNGG
jgi:hypothetical protein